MAIVVVIVDVTEAVVGKVRHPRLTVVEEVEIAMAIMDETAQEMVTFLETYFRKTF